MKHVVLVIDDDGTIRELISDVLVSFDHSVVLASDAEEGFDIAQLSQPTLIICDVMLPDRIGFDLIADLKKQPAFANTPVIFITGYPYVQQNMPAVENCHWLLKPFSVKDLTDKIGAIAKPVVALRSRP